VQRVAQHAVQCIGVDRAGIVLGEARDPGGRGREPGQTGCAC
jgi:hypothetical protein